MTWLCANPRVSLRGVAVATLAVLMFGVCADSASAACGDWLAESGEMDHSTPAESPVVPCSGPNCRRGPAAPLPLEPAPTLTDSRHHWAQVTAIRPPAPLATARSVEPGSPLLPAGFPRALERPPRS